MPTYEYRCDDCETTFARTEHIEEHEEAHPECPNCGSRNVRPQLSSFFAKTGRKS